MFDYCTNNTEPGLPDRPKVQALGRWFAIQTRPRHEKAVANGLQEKGISVFLPLSSAVHQWSDRRRLIQNPLFVGYVFVRVAESSNDRVSILRTAGVTNFVGNRSVGTPIPDSQVEAVRMIVEQGLPFTPHPFLRIGQRVRIQGGSLDGLQGILVAVNGDQSLVVSVELMQRSLAIRITGYRVEPV